MNQRRVELILYLVKWTVLASIVGILVGSASAFFLVSLEWATSMQHTYTWLLFLLPFGGALVSYTYWKYGQNASKGNNLIIEQAQGEEESVPFRMAPLVLGGTIITHLFGGSAGREGTAVQMGGAFSELVAKVCKLDKIDRKIILICGISSGFGSVFGTPLAGTIFALEVLAIGMIRHEALFPSFVAACIGNIVTVAWGVGHHPYDIGDVPVFSWLLVMKVVLAAILFGLTSRVFSGLTHWMKRGFVKLFVHPVWRSFVGGVLFVLLTLLIGTRDYTGLGIPLIDQAFDGTVATFAFLMKLFFTALTLGAGYQGGEVTPLFVIGSSLGSTLGSYLDVSIPFLAALGFIGVFCSATSTPIACFIMGIELFGSEAAIYFFLVCIISYVCSGHTGIYTSQQIGVSKRKAVRAKEYDTIYPIRQNK
ncbi:voltage-gated chloride channel family protein [Priestia taiwanensis]|uniref:Voltage-gated chloride channel protein n=1 Tax=Priestia taiwanensis TaxID=1347902 RepID=A0A917ENS1_9BACI|nr:voltage-gated chloride channel family protein [Priestia taiwanensis]MBM7363157.1 H+/Cl- antiporter ClcA [Priestia taiwanensis]GGE68167.1 voltage-gated chloride channel protein [Priestia taiwanensis]